ncbi:hypothetical protein ADK76_10010 [Streptomyces griseoflavus]|uniref:hypothetical protein n=1 Tax=Streptomyces rimosus TaxID=1927 RepID=UPI0004C54575|nr:hypothetical protein [Streptomyces rimosus]KOG64178.1 hypothetical protein ADK76_10010 [Streptomyces griseoflavus]
MTTDDFYATAPSARASWQRTDPLARRNEAIMRSPVPLRTTLRLTLKNAMPGRRIADWRTFLREVGKVCA